MYAKQLTPASASWHRDALVRKYRAGVRIGNWFEDTVAAQNEMALFRRRCDNGSLAFQLVEQMFGRFHRQIHMPAKPERLTPDGFVRLGALVNVIAAEWPNWIDGDGGSAVGPLALAASLAEDHVGTAKDITDDDCHLAVAPMACACARNTFRIVGADGQQHCSDEPLAYNQHFRLELAECPAERTMVVHSSVKCGAAANVARSPHTFHRNGETNQSVGLGVRTVPRVQARWKCLYRRADFRYENEGEPVKLNCDLIILHVASNRMLAAEPTWSKSAFGMELGVSATTYRDVYGHETYQNTWKFAAIEHGKR